MEKKSINFSFNSLVTRFRRAHKENLDPNTLWRAVLWAGLIGISGVAIFAYVTYDWALSIEAPSAVTRSSRDSLSLSELEEVIALYHQKEVNFAALQRTAPEAPEYRRAKGVIATSTTAIPFDDSTGVISAPVRTQ
jgi:hypothetical protein